jgi:shikimate dehydrogenase
MTPPAARRQTLVLGPCRIEYLGSEATQVLGVVGHPVAQSLSPRMQQAALDAAGSDATYVAMDVAANGLAAFVQAARRVQRPLRGFNVTVPHKSAVVPLLDGMDATAALAAAVNTVVIDAQRGFQGANTDVGGLQEVWRQNHVRLRDRRLIILGAGGLARAAVVAGLREAAGEICVMNRTVAHAQAMLDDISSRWPAPPGRFRCAALSGNLDAWLPEAAALVQATPVGAQVGAALPVSLRGAPADLFVFESLYGAPTPLLQEARQRRLQAVDGRVLLVAQGAASWRLWMDADPDLDAMRQAVGLGACT